MDVSAVAEPADAATAADPKMLFVIIRSPEYHIVPDLFLTFHNGRDSWSNAKQGQRLFEKRSEFRDRLSLHFLHNPLS